LYSLTKGDAHVKLGLIVWILALVQGVLGFLINKWFDPARSSTPFSDKLHWWLGRLLVTGAIINVFLGSYFYENLYGTVKGKTMAIAGFVIVALSIAGFFGGEYFIGQKHHNGGENKAESNAMLHPE
jgi:hypothetical protein